jgi:ubiquinone/menaquinone biosynthesis C-methylase UbiE
MSFAEYSQKHRHVLIDELPLLLERVAKPGVLADLGCGDGSNIWALHRAHKLGSATYAIDLSPDRVRQAEKAAAGVQGVVADATATTLPDACVDGVIASQVIEHLPDDRLLAAEITRILKPGGWWYIGSVLRSSHAWWVYRNEEGERLLDPTHLREYRTRGDFEAAIAHPGLAVAEIGETPFRFPL